MINPDEKLAQKILDCCAEHGRIVPELFSDYSEEELQEHIAICVFRGHLEIRNRFGIPIPLNSNN